jgi:hypothetical protein
VIRLQIDPEEFRRHYASLSDEGLRDLDRSELTGVAQKCYDEEVALRDLSPQQVEASAPPAWIGESACACTFASFPGSFAASDAANAREVLEAAGIPCHISVDEIEHETPVDDSPVRYEYRLMVPGALNLHATSVLDREIFNPEVEAEWAAHFQALSDEELHALSPEVICAGLEDRIMRLKRAYAAEVDRRELGGSQHGVSDGQPDE